MQLIDQLRLPTQRRTILDLGLVVVRIDFATKIGDSVQMEHAQSPYPTPQAESQTSTQALDVDDAVLNALKRTRPWVTFLGILGLVLVGFIVLGGVTAAVTSLHAPSPFPGFGLALGLVYVLVSLLYLFPAIYLVRYGRKIRDLQLFPVQANLVAAIAQQASFWRYVGIAAVVLLCIYALAIVGAVVAAIAGAIPS